MPFNDKVLGKDVVPILNDDSTVTALHRSSFLDQVSNVLSSGNAGGGGMTKAGFPLSVPLPPTAGPTLVNPGTSSEDMMWFKPEPNAAASIDVLRKDDSTFNTVFIDRIYAPIVSSLNVPGAVKTFPIMDPTAALDVSRGIDFGSLPGFAKDVGVFMALYMPVASSPTLPPTGLPTDPEKIILTALKANYDLTYTSILKTKLTIDIAANLPKVPQLPIPYRPPTDFNVLNDLMMGLAALPPKLIPQIITQIASLDFLTSLDVTKLFTKFVALAFEMLMVLLAAPPLSMNKLVPRLLMAALTVIVVNVIVMCIIVAIGTTFGAGRLCQLVATTFGLH